MIIFWRANDAVKRAETEPHVLHAGKLKKRVQADLSKFKFHFQKFGDFLRFLHVGKLGNGYWLGLFDMPNWGYDCRFCSCKKVVQKLTSFF